MANIHRRLKTPGSSGIILCGTGKLQPRDECPNALHDYPLFVSYVWSEDEAHRRLENEWENLECPDCGRYGWKPPDKPA